MKYSLALIVPVFMFSSLWAQAQVAGKYQYFAFNDTTGLFNHTMLTLNCDHTFVAIDSSLHIQTKGTWKIRNSLLLVSVTSTQIDSKTDTRTRRVKYLVKRDTIYRKIESEKKYERETKRWNRQLPEPVPFEEYKIYAEREDGSFFKCIEPYTCT